MKERPILFNSADVNAVLSGRKTQTRRIVKNQREGDSWSVKPAVEPRHTGHTHDWWLPTGLLPYSALPICPFGAVGDRLWVRETFCVVPRTAYATSEGVQQIISPSDSHDAAIFRSGWERSTGGISWKPSIHMPRWASRITLEITSVRVERLNSINEHDAIAEGLAEISKDGRTYKYGVPDRDGYPGTDDFGWPWHEWERYPISAYSKLWKSIYGEESWQANPWVWCIEFKRVEIES